MGYKMQLSFSFTEELTDAEGDKIIVDVCKDKIKVVAEMLNCSKTKAGETLKLLEKEYEVFCKNNQVLLCQNKKIIYNFETYGMTFGTKNNPHKYNELNEWDFRSFLEGKKTRAEKKAPKTKKVLITCTETQIKRAEQLYFAKQIGFNVSYKDYKRFYLVP